ncbi:MFS transporter [Fusibacter bizertensis]
MGKRLWSKNYTLIIVGTIISAIGGVGMSLALSVTVYSNTQSTWLTGLYSALTFIPGVVLPVLVSPLIDRFSRKKIVVNLDFFMGFMLLLFAFFTQSGLFNYIFYVVMGLLMSINGVVYNLAYSSLFPSLIPKGKFQQGYAIGNLIYPLTNVLVLPVATIIFQKFGVSILFAIEGIMLLIASTFERFIDHTQEKEEGYLYSIKNHFDDIGKGFKYLINEKGIWNVYWFFVVMMFADGISVLIYPFFEQSSTLTVLDYSLLLSFQSAGYMFGGLVHYFVKIPTQWRYGISVIVYFAFAILGGALFFMPFFLMLASKFILGIMGMNSANIRITSINDYIDTNMRGRLNAVFQTMVSVSMLFGQLTAGWLGEFVPIKYISVLYGAIIGMGIIFFVLRKQTEIKFLYNREV